MTVAVVELVADSGIEAVVVDDFAAAVGVNFVAVGVAVVTPCH